MTATRAKARSHYMEWAKLCSTAKFNLATSGMVSLPLAELDVKFEQIEINGPSIYGYGPLLEAIAARYNVPRECVVSALGTSLANYLALAAATETSDEILVEKPTYEPILSTARYLGLQIRRFSRPAAQNFAIDLHDLERNLTSHTRVIALTNLHNPSGALCSHDVLRDVAGLARKVNAYVLVDEVYREMLFETWPQSAFHIDPERFLITNSLTKAYGLSGLRCGWVLAPPALAERMWHINDVHGSTFTHPGELLGVIAFEKLGLISARMKSLLEANRNLLRNFLNSFSQLDYFWPEQGAIVFPRLRAGSVDAFCEMLHKEFETSVVPGRFFECPDRFRIGVGTPTDEVRQGLERLARGLEKYRTELSQANT